MKVKEMWKLDEDAVAALKALPETGMGFQLVEGSFWGRVAPLLVFNTERAYDLSTIGLEPGDDPATILRNGLKIVELLKGEIARTIIAAPSPRIHGLLGSRIGTLPAAPVATAAAGIVTALPSSLVKHLKLPSDRTFHRFSAFKPDPRIDPVTGDFLSGTYDRPQQGEAATLAVDAVLPRRERHVASPAAAALPDRRPGTKETLD